MGVAATVVLVVVVSFFGRVHWIDDGRYEYYRKLDKSFGKYYSMQELLEKDALYEYDDSNMDDYISASLMAGLKDDKYAAYMNKSQYSDMQKRLFSSYIGIGVGISEQKEGIVIRTARLMTRA